MKFSDAGFLVEEANGLLIETAASENSYSCRRSLWVEAELARFFRPSSVLPGGENVIHIPTEFQRVDGAGSVGDLIKGVMERDFQSRNTALQPRQALTVNLLAGKKS